MECINLKCTERPHCSSSHPNLNTCTVLQLTRKSAFVSLLTQLKLFICAFLCRLSKLNKLVCGVVAEQTPIEWRRHAPRAQFRLLCKQEPRKQEATNDESVFFFYGCRQIESSASSVQKLFGSLRGAKNTYFKRTTCASLKKNIYEIIKRGAPFIFFATCLQRI